MNKFLLFKHFLLLLTITFFFIILNNNQQQSFAITYSYFSGAANSSLTEWKISIDDQILNQDKNNKIDSFYKFTKSINTVNNSENDFGYIIWIKIAKFLFPWFGDINSIKILQFIIHILIFYLFYMHLKNFNKILIFIGFGINPIFIYYALFPFYYYITLLPVCLFILFKYNNINDIRFHYLFFAFLFLTAISRSTIIFLIFPYLIIYLNRKISFKHLILLLIIFFVTYLYFYTSYFKSLWHTAYVGIGGYSNNLGINSLDDSHALNLYKSITNEPFTQIPYEEYFNDISKRNNYNLILKNEYLDILQNNFILIIRNFIYNFIVLFGFGYIVKSNILTLISAIIGILHIISIIYYKKWFNFFIIVTLSLPIILLFPPIPVYILPSLLFSCINIFEIVAQRSK